MKTFFSFTLWGTLILIFSGCCFNLMPQSSQEEQWPTKNGLEMITYPDGSPKVRALYTEGILNGEFKTWYPNGQIRCVRQYQQGKRVGEEMVYYPDGKTYSQGDYRQGNYKTYHRNGRLQIAKDSLESDGTHHFYRWNSAGVLIETVPLVNSKMEGLHQYWSAQGKLMAKGQETAGLRTGLWEYFDETGGLTDSHDYGEGSSIGEQSEARVLGKVPTYHHDGYAYLLENDNAMGQSAPVVDWPSINDYYQMYLEETIIEPKPINMAEIQQQIGYPKYARDNGIQGNVVVRMLIDEKGIPVDNRVITMLSPYISNQVEYYLMDLRFSPASYKGEPMPFWVNIPFNFKLLN